jgi:hypothetical protein
MKHLRFTVFLQFMTALALGEAASQSWPAPLPEDPEAPVRSLYTEVVNHHPSGLPTEAEMKILAPYLSKELRQRIELANACAADWEHKSPDPKLIRDNTSGFVIFSGDGVSPNAFQIENTVQERDGSFQVSLRLEAKSPHGRSWTWRVAPVVIRQGDHYSVDDIIYVNDSVWDHPEDKPADRRLSQYLSAGCDGAHWAGLSLPNEPEAFAQSLYREAVTRRPVGIPSGEDWKIFAPYLSKTLLQRIDSALSCGADWDRQNPDPDLKPEIAWFELGIFTGGDDEGELHAFQFERLQPEADGAILTIMKLMWGRSPQSWISHVAVKLARENGRLAVDDVIYLRDGNQETDWRLSQSLSAGCDGPRWIGYHNGHSDQRQQK